MKIAIPIFDKLPPATGPHPPFSGGSVASAPPEIVEFVRTHRPRLA